MVGADGGGLGDSLLGVMAPESREIRSILDFREAIEPPITVARRAPGDARGPPRLTAAVGEMERAGSLADYATLDRRFHGLVARATHNPLLWRIVEVTADWMASIRQDTLQSPERQAASLAGHRAILDAIVHHDPAAAAAATVEHVKSIGSIVAAVSPPGTPTHPPGDPLAPSSPRRVAAPSRQEVRRGITRS